MIVLTAAVAATLVVAAVLEPSLPREALVPLAAGMLFFLAAAVAALAWLRPLPRKYFDYWDVAGVLTFIAVCVSAAVEPEQMVRLVTDVDRSP
jgi:hypothetical protein